MTQALSWSGDYAVRTALQLARVEGDGRWWKAADIAAATAVPEGYVRQILRLLVRHHVARSHAGRQGGYRLARPAARVSLLDAVEAGEGRLLSRRCVLRGVRCGRGRTCELHAHWLAAQQAMRESLAAVTLADVVSGVAQPASAPSN